MDLACMISFALKRSVVSKLITNQNSSPTHLIFLHLAQMNLHFVAISYTAWRNIEDTFEWMHSSGLNLWNERLQISLFLSWLSLSWYHIHPTLTSTDLILTRTIGIQWCIQSSNFWKKKKPILTKGMWSILLLSQSIEGKLMNFRKCWYYTSCFLSQVFNAFPGFCNRLFLWWSVIQSVCIQRSLQCNYC